MKKRYSFYYARTLIAKNYFDCHFGKSEFAYVDVDIILSKDSYYFNIVCNGVTIRQDISDLLNDWVSLFGKYNRDCVNDDAYIFENLCLAVGYKISFTNIVLGKLGIPKYKKIPMLYSFLKKLTIK